jgi:hypothetical protein
MKSSTAEYCEARDLSPAPLAVGLGPRDRDRGFEANQRRDVKRAAVPGESRHQVLGEVLLVEDRADA